MIGTRTEQQKKDGRQEFVSKKNKKTEIGKEIKALETRGKESVDVPVKRMAHAVVTGGSFTIG